MRIKQLLIIILWSLLSAGDSLAADATSEKRDTSAQYEEALIQFQNNELSTAVIHLKNILKQDPNHLASHLLLGRAYVLQSEGALAERELEAARRLGADRALIEVPLGKAYKLQRRYSKILDNIQEGDFLPDRNSEIMVLRGEAYLALGDIKNAEMSFNRASKYNPGATAPILGKVSVLMRKRKFAEINQLMQKAIELNPLDSEVWHTKGSVAHLQHQFKEAIKDYRKALDLEANNYTYLVSMAGAYMDMGEYEKALSVINELDNDEGEEKSDPQVPYLKGVIYSRLGKAEESHHAMTEAGSIMARLPTEIKEKHLETLLLSGLIDYSLGRFDEAYTSLDLYVRRTPGHPGARKLMAAILLSRGKYDQVIQVLKPAVAKIPNDYRLLTMLGTAYMKKGRHLRAIELLDRAVELGGKAVEARTQLAISHLLQGKGESGLKQLSEVFVSSEKALKAGVALVLEHLRRNQNEQAIKIASLLSERQPDNLNILNLLASSEIAAGKIESAARHLEHILEKNNNYLPAILNLAKIDIAFGKFLEAEARIEQAEQTHPEAILVKVERARLEDAKGNLKQALELMRKVVAINDQSVVNNIYLSEILVRLGNNLELEQHLQKMERIFPDHIGVMRNIGISHLAQGKPAKARTQFRRITKAAGYNRNILMDTAGLLLAARDHEGASWALLKVLEDSPGFEPAMIRLAEVYLAGGKLEPASEIIANLMQQHANKPDSHRLQAQLALAKGDFNQAVAGFTKALEMGGGQNVAMLSFQAYLRSGDVRGGVEFLEGYIKKAKVNTTGLNLRLAEGYLRLNKLNSAKEIYEGLAKAGVKNARLYNNLAMIRLKQGDNDAIQTAKLAYEIDPESPMINDTLGWILVKNGKPAEGLRYLRNASLRASSNKSIRYHIAAALADLGRVDEARQQLSGLVSTGKGFREYAEAKALLDRLSGKK